MMKVGIFLPNWVGDVVMATPTLRALRRYMGREATFIGMMKPYVEGVLQGTSWLDEIWFYDRLNPDPEMRPAALTRRIFRSRLDLVVMLPNDFLSAFISWLGRAKKRMGYVRNRRGPFLTIKLYPSMANGKFVATPTLDYYLQLAYALGCPNESWKMELATTDEDERMADQVGEALGLRSDGKVVLFNSSGAYGQAKLWPDEYFSELANRVVKELDHDVLILCGPLERERAARIVYMAGNPKVFSLAEQKLSLGLSKALVRRSRLLVTTDSGPRHFAAAFEIPLITLFGPTHMAWGDIRYDKELCLQIPVDCGPCQQRVCPFQHHRCMIDLSVDEVYRAVCRQLKK